ncbi:MAG: glutamate--tRNA ligase family protein, partial [Desulfonatronovibrio sp.]
MENNTKSNFIRDIIEEDLKSGKHNEVITRFPPEPNGYLHIGHAKSICLNFGVVRDYGGKCHMRFDDTNPKKENPEFVKSIMDDVSWLGFDWGEHLYHASDYFQQLYEYGLELIKRDKAYVCSLTPEEIREYRGTLTEPGRNSPHRDR